MTRKSLFIAYLILLHLLLAIVLTKSDFISRIKARFDIRTEDSAPPFYQAMLAFHLRMDGNVPDHAVIFIGDSITQGLAVTAVTSNAVNYGIGSDTTLGVLHRIPLYTSLRRADWVVLAIGINDLHWRSNEEILENYRRILQALPAGIRIAVSAILPVDERYTREQRNNDRIEAINRALASLGKEFPNLVFLNIGPELNGPDGNLRAIYHTGDGIHLNTAGYRVWIKSLGKMLRSSE